MAELLNKLKNFSPYFSCPTILSLQTLPSSLRTNLKISLNLCPHFLKRSISLPSLLSQAKLQKPNVLFLFERKVTILHF